MTPESAMSRVYTDFSGLAKLRASAANDAPEALEKVAKEFEASFVGMLVKSMRDASIGEDLLENDATKMYEEMFDKQLAIDISERGEFGIAKLIVDTMKEKQAMPTVEPDVKGFGPSASPPVSMGVLSSTTFMASQQRNVNPIVSQATTAAESKPVISLNDHSLALRKANIQRIKNTDNTHVVQNTNGQPVVSVRDQKTTFSSPEDFIMTMRPLAEKAGKKIGVDPDLLVAQAALETGWGKKIMKNGQGESSFNLFGIKASSNWEGGKVNVGSLEYRNGVARREVSPFRTYQSFEQSFNDYANLIKNQPRYAKAVEVAGNSRQYIQELQKAGYATDPNYARKVVNIMERKSLSKVWLASMGHATNRS